MGTETFTIDLRSFPPGMIGLPCGEQARWSDFVPSILGLAKPPGTTFKMGMGLGPAAPLNGIARTFMSVGELEWLFLVNDDNLYPTDTLARLLHRMYGAGGVGGGTIAAITGLYLGRLQPFAPIAFDGITEVPLDVIERTYSSRWYNKLMLTDQGGMLPIMACGDGCLLLHRNVLADIPFPWWEYGETVPGSCDHDMVLCRKIRDAGYQIWLDTDVRVDHVTSMVVRPVKLANGKWAVHLVQGEDKKILMPSATPQAAFNLEGAHGKSPK